MSSWSQARSSWSSAIHVLAWYPGSALVVEYGWLRHCIANARLKWGSVHGGYMAALNNAGKVVSQHDRPDANL